MLIFSKIMKNSGGNNDFAALPRLKSQCLSETCESAFPNSEHTLDRISCSNLSLVVAAFGVSARI